VIIVVAVVLLSAHAVPTTASTTTLLPVSTPTTTSVQTPATAFSQASAINHLLQSAPQDRAQLQNAVDVIQSSIDERNGTCSPAAVNAVSEIKTVANGREDLLIQLSVTSMSDVPGGGQVLASLRSAWIISLRIDRAFGQWATVELDNGCALSDSVIPSYHTTAILDPQSTAIKTRFVEEWNPIASQYGLPANWSADQI
jgi:predicted RND superfamily exporter protein